jgi:hypothetical protein
MRAVVIDTNVGVAANGNSPQADQACRSASAAALRDARANSIVVIDDGFRILREYINNVSRGGQPGAGTRFVQCLLQNQRNPTVCEQVRITPGPALDDFLEFPNDPELEGFDLSDRKFVAVARASANRPTILNAVDTRSWPRYREHLARHDVHVECLCPHLTRPQHSCNGNE